MNQLDKNWLWNNIFPFSKSKRNVSRSNPTISACLLDERLDRKVQTTQYFYS